MGGTGRDGVVNLLEWNEVKEWMEGDWARGVLEVRVHAVHAPENQGREMG